MKTKRIKSAIPIYGCAALWLLAGLIVPGALLRLSGLLLTAAASAFAYAALSKVFPGREVEVRDKANSGDKNIDALIEDGRKQLDSLKDANAAIPEAEISQKLERMTRAGEQILQVLEKDTSQAQAVRKFMNYYLPTADKLMANYRLMRETKNPGENMAHAMRAVENSLGMIADAFEKQLDNLYKDRTLDIETDIDVLETMMASDGLTDLAGAQAKKQ